MERIRLEMNYYRIRLFKGSFCGTRPPCWLTRTGSIHDYGFCGTKSIKLALVISEKAFFSTMLLHFLRGKEYELFSVDLDSVSIYGRIDSPDEFGGDSYMKLVQYEHMIRYNRSLPYVYEWETDLPGYDADAIIQEFSRND